MPTPQELEAAAGIQPAGELERKQIWAAAEVNAGPGQPPSAADLRLAEAMLDAARKQVVAHESGGGGRAVITLTDSGEEEVDVAVEFQPDLEDLGGGEVAGTPAQLLALQLLEAVAEGHDHPHDHDHEH